MTSNGWEEYRLLVKNHIEKEEAFQSRVEERLDGLDRKLAAHLGASKVLAVVIPFVVSLLVSVAAIAWGI
jgi:hypothetical protein